MTLWDTSDEGDDKNINEMIALVLEVSELALKLPEVSRFNLLLMQKKMFIIIIAYW